MGLLIQKQGDQLILKLLIIEPTVLPSSVDTKRPSLTTPTLSNRINLMCMLYTTGEYHLKGKPDIKKQLKISQASSKLILKMLMHISIEGAAMTRLESWTSPSAITVSHLSLILDPATMMHKQMSCNKERDKANN